jgi:hypothetical protein
MYKFGLGLGLGHVDFPNPELPETVCQTFIPNGLLAR